MRWSNSRYYDLIFAASLVVIGLAGFTVFESFAASPPVPPKQLTIYSTVANYSLPVAEYHGTDYVGLLELLEPLGTVNATVKGKQWNLRFNNAQAAFVQNSATAVVAGQSVRLNAPFALQNGRGAVSLNSLAALLPHFLNRQITWSPSSRRLIIGSVAVHFTAQIVKNNPPTLVMQFTSPVNPQVSTEPGKLILKFTHEAVVTPGTAVLTFGNKEITSASYSETDGTAALTIAGKVPLFASFSNNGRTITVEPSAQAAIQMQAQAAQKMNPAAPGPPALNAGTVPTTVPTGAQSYFVVIDAAHGGQERGAALSGQLGEKDITLAIARRLRQELQDRGITSFMLRDGDATLTLDQRAVMTNHIHPAMYICIHASSAGSGVGLYTSLLPPLENNRGPFMSWSTAQAAFLPASQSLENSLASALQQSHISVRALSAPVRPLNNLAVPGVAVEVAPSAPGVTADLAYPTYQELVASSLAVGIAEMRGHAPEGTP